MPITALQALNELEEQGSLSEYPGDLIQKMRSRFGGLEERDRENWRLLSNEIDLETIEGGGGPDYVIAEQSLEIVKRVASCLLDGRLEKKPRDGMEWIERMSWCEKPEEFRAFLLAIGTNEWMWAKAQSRMARKSGGWSGVLKVIREDQRFKSWKSFYPFLMQGRTSTSSIPPEEIRELSFTVPGVSQSVVEEVQRKIAANVSNNIPLWQVLSALQILPKERQMAARSGCGIQKSNLDEEVVAKVFAKLMRKGYGLDDMNWKERSGWCTNRLDYMRLFQLIELDPNKLYSRQSVIRQSYPDLADVLEDRYGSLEEFIVWLFPSTPLAKVRSCRSIQGFLEIVEKFGDRKTNQDLLAAVKSNAVLKDMQERLDALPEDTKWPWEAICTAWGAQGEEEDEEQQRIGRHRGTLSSIVAKTIQNNDGLSGRDKSGWRGRYEWCREDPIAFCSLLRSINAPEDCWAIRDWFIRNGWSGLANVIEDDFGSWEKFYDWLVQGSPYLELLRIRSAEECVNFVQRHGDTKSRHAIEDETDIGMIIGDMQSRLDLLPNDVEWPWEAICLAWGSEDETSHRHSEKTMGKRRKDIAIAIANTFLQYDGRGSGSCRGWKDRFKWCGKDDEKFRRFLETIGVPKEFLPQRKSLIGKFNALVTSVEDELQVPWTVFHEFIDSKHPRSHLPNKRDTKASKEKIHSDLREACSSRNVTRLIEFSKKYGDDSVISLLETVEKEDAVIEDMQKRLDKLSKDLEWPWEALCTAWGGVDDFERDDKYQRMIGTERRMLSGVITKVIEKHDGFYNGRKGGWKERIAWCKDNNSKFQLLFGAIGFAEDRWSHSAGLKKLGWGGLQKAINDRLGFDDWQEFYEWLLPNNPRRKIETSRTMEQFLALVDDFGSGMQKETVRTTTDLKEVIADMQCRLESLSDDVTWPWEAVCKAWGSLDKNEFDDEQKNSIAKRRRALSKVILQIMDEKLKHSGLESWKDRIAWCRGPEQLQLILRAFDAPEEKWHSANWISKNLSLGLVGTVKNKFSASWEQCYDLFAPDGLQNRIKTARDVRTLLDIVEKFGDERSIQATQRIDRCDQVIADMQEKLDKLPNDIQWPWEAMSMAWGVDADGSESDEKTVEGRFKLSASIMGTLQLHDGLHGRSGVWKQRLGRCWSSAERFRQFLLALGVPRDKLLDRIWLMEHKHFGLIQAIEQDQIQKRSGKDVYTGAYDSFGPWTRFSTKMDGRLPWDGFTSEDHVFEYIEKEILRLKERGELLGSDLDPAAITAQDYDVFLRMSNENIVRREVEKYFEEVRD